MSCSRRRCGERPDRAFALVLALLLLSGVVLAVTGLGLLTRVELATGGARDDAARARRHALVAFELALEHLQREAGPDDRVTARAEILGDTPGPGGMLTGVWGTDGGDPRLRTWLVSGNAAEDPLAVGPGDVRADPDGDRLLLVGAGTVAPPARRIALPLQPLRLPADSGIGRGQTSVEGRYAYWIGDEGVKASFALGAGESPPAGDLRAWVETVYGRLLIGDDWTGGGPFEPRLREAVVGPSLQPAFPALPAPDDVTRLVLRPRLERVLFHAQAPFVAPAVTRASARANGEAFTPLSRGVLVNLHDWPARLRIDATVPPVPGAPAIDGFLRTRPAPGAGGAYAVGGGPGAFAVAPVPTEVLLRLGVRTDLGAGRLALEAELEVELWNPYAAPLVVVHDRDVTLRVEGAPGMRIRAGSGEERHPVPLPARLRFAPGLRWEPGQVRILRGGHLLSASASPASRLTGVSVPASIGEDVEVAVEAIPAGAAFGVRLEADGRAEAGLLSNHGYESAKVLAGPPPTDSSWHFFLGVEAGRDPRGWTDGSRADARDPRDRSGGDLPTEDNGGRWTRDPSRGPTAVPGAGAGFCEARRLVRFDLPVQEPHSVGYLQHVPTGRLRGIGNPWGGEANAWFDRLYLSAAPPGAAVFGRSGNPFLESLPPASRLAVAETAEDPTGSAARLLLRGAFNVHSTSAMAWEAVLDRAVYWRFPHAGEDAGGPRRLDSGERRALAREIVAALRRRGRPFASLAALASSGLVAGAIDAAGINSALAPAQSGEPGWLEQADVLGALAPVLVPRSDTFLVRAGAETPSTGAPGVPARAWCEAEVQRLPELWTPPGAPAAEAADVRQPDPARHPLGRRFRVLHFRWLSESDL